MAKLKREVEGDDGWSDWVHPIPRKYKMGCCDCGLVHNMDFRVVKVLHARKDGSFTYEEVKGTRFRVMFKAQRNSRSTAQCRRHKKRK